MRRKSFHTFRWLILAVVAIGFSVCHETATVAIDLSLAAKYFQEAHTLCREEGGKLWGISLCGPMLFVDRQTRQAVANQSDRQGNLKKEGEVFVGLLPAGVNMANTATRWGGVHWTMVIWPLPTDPYQRANLMAHELWHRVQEELKLPGSMPACAHLDTLEGRVWLQLEWRALRSALRHGIRRGGRHAIQDALLFRAYRRSLFPNAEVEERRLEMSEGLAEYTGQKLSRRTRPVDFAADQLQAAETKDSFVRSFAYVTGPAYGLLLDGAGAQWRKGLTPKFDLAYLLREALLLKWPSNLKQETEARARLYDAHTLRAAETARENARQERIAFFRARLLKEAVVAIPLQRMSMQFNPENLQPLDEAGTVYPHLRVVDVWGILTVSKGALMNPTFTRVFVPAPKNITARPLEGDGWTLVPGDRAGDYVLKKLQ